MSMAGNSRYCIKHETAPVLRESLILSASGSPCVLQKRDSSSTEGINPVLIYRRKEWPRLRTFITAVRFSRLLLCLSILRGQLRGAARFQIPQAIHPSHNTSAGRKDAHSAFPTTQALPKEATWECWYNENSLRKKEVAFLWLLSRRGSSFAEKSSSSLSKWSLLLR